MVIRTHSRCQVAEVSYLIMPKPISKVLISTQITIVKGVGSLYRTPVHSLVTNCSTANGSVGDRSVMGGSAVG